jgi:hypothetical protein
MVLVGMFGVAKVAEVVLIVSSSDVDKQKVID